MKTKTLLIAASIVVSANVYSQGYSLPKFDSLNNSLTSYDIKSFVGQSLYLTPHGMAAQGYKGFTKEIKKEKSKSGGNTLKAAYGLSSSSKPDTKNIYNCCAENPMYGSVSKYEGLAGKEFEVIDAVTQMGDYTEEKFLKLKIKGTEEVVFYKVEGDNYFVINGFYENQKRKLIGKELIFSTNYIKKAMDITTQKQITSTTGEKWKCVDIIKHDPSTGYSMLAVMQNSKGEKITLGSQKVNPTFYELDYKDGKPFYAISLPQAAELKKKVGEEFYKAILDGEVKIGMNKEMCSLIIGTPVKVSETQMGENKYEYWYLDKNYTKSIAFKNGKVNILNK